MCCLRLEIICVFTEAAWSICNMYICSKYFPIIFSFGIAPKTIYSQGYYFLMGKTLVVPKLNSGPECYLQRRGFLVTILEHVHMKIFKSLGLQTKCL